MDITREDVHAFLASLASQGETEWGFLPITTVDARTRAARWFIDQIHEVMSYTGAAQDFRSERDEAAAVERDAPSPTIHAERQPLRLVLGGLPNE